MGEKVYIAGKITGDPSYEIKFEHEERRQCGMGNIPLNPAILPGGMAQEDYLHICFAMIDVADKVVFLPDWVDSPGAKKEMAYCQKKRKKIVRLDTE